MCEWVEDAWHPGYGGAPADGSAWGESGGDDRRVIRGGAWDYLPRLLRSAWRDSLPRSHRRDNLGFRLAACRAAVTCALLLFRSLWTNGFDLEAALADCRGGSFDGVEGPVPAAPAERREFAARLAGCGAPFIAEITTGGRLCPD